MSKLLQAWDDAVDWYVTRTESCQLQLRLGLALGLCLLLAIPLWGSLYWLIIAWAIFFEEDAEKA